MEGVHSYEMRDDDVVVVAVDEDPVLSPYPSPYGDEEGLNGTGGDEVVAGDGFVNDEDQRNLFLLLLEDDGYIVDQRDLLLLLVLQPDEMGRLGSELVWIFVAAVDFDADGDAVTLQ